jgi:hypothetical protein
MVVRIIKAGEESQQGIGYLDDGTMVVVEEGKGKIGEKVQITVTSALQTSAGRMIFGKYERTSRENNNSDHNEDNDRDDRQNNYRQKKQYS